MRAKYYGYRLGGSKKWIRTKPLRYLSPRYGKWIIIDKGYESDGATGAIDMASNAWWVHDKICETGTWHNGSPCSRWQASMVLHDVLVAEAYCESDLIKWFRAKYWFVATYYFGCFKTKRKPFWRRKGGDE